MFHVKHQLLNNVTPRRLFQYQNIMLVLLQKQMLDPGYWILDKMINIHNFRHFRHFRHYQYHLLPNAKTTEN